MIKFKKILTVIMASLLALTVVFSVGCKPDGGETDEYKITLNYNDEEVVDGVVVKEASRPLYVYVEKGSKMDEPKKPKWVGYTFVNWTDSKEGGKAINFSSYTPTEDTTLYAHWEPAVYEVDFNFNIEGVDEPAYRQSVEHNTKIPDPFEGHVKSALSAGTNANQYVHSSKPNSYTIGQWATKADSTAPVTFPYNVNKEVAFYLIWYSNDVTLVNITLDYNYPNNTASDPVLWKENVVGGTAIEEKPTNPKYNDYTFKGWALTPNATAADIITFPWTAPGTSTTLYAVWERTVYTIRFNLNYTGAANGGEYKVFNYISGNTITAADVPNPTRSHKVGTDELTFEFDGWYNGTSYVNSTKVELPINVTQNLRLYAKWKAPAYETNKFEAEYSTINPDNEYPGYSGSASGAKIIQADLEGTSTEPAYPILGGVQEDQNEFRGHYITYLFMQYAMIVYHIWSDKDVDNVTLKAAMSTEFVPSLTISPTNENAFYFVVNPENLADPTTYKSIAYSPITINGGTSAPGGLYKGTVFNEYTVSSTVSLKAGENIVILMTANSNAVGGGTTKGIAPTFDYIKLETSAAKLWYYPEYDNIYNR